jgi:glucose/arabinose dehydrogenase
VPPTTRGATSTRSTARAAPSTTRAGPAGSFARSNENVLHRGLARRSMPTACAGVPVAQYPGEVATGWAAVKVKGDMISARGVIFDSAGNLLVVESGKGITAHTLDATGCIVSSKTLIKQNNLNHGIYLNGTTLYASSITTVWKWTYDPKAIAVGSTKTVVVAGMYNGGHPTRTLIISPNHPNLLAVSHGSNDNFDFPSGNVNVARANIKVFDMDAVPTGGYNYVTGGHTPAYGLRNEVGLTFDPNNMFVGTIKITSDLR